MVGFQCIHTNLAVATVKRENSAAMDKLRLFLPSRKDRTLLILLLALVAGASLISITYRAISGGGDQGPMRKFGGKELGLSIQYPPYWNAFPTPQGAHGDKDVIGVILAPGRSFPQLYIARHVFQSRIMADVVAWGAVRAEQRTGYTEISLQELQLESMSTVVREYSWKNQTLFAAIVVRCKDLYALHADAGYDLSFCAERGDWATIFPTLQKMMTSIYVFP